VDNIILQRGQSVRVEHVVAAVVTNNSNEVLLSLRPPHVHQGGKWEFPGGKVESGEKTRQALDRELDEELGIVPVTARPKICLLHDYPDKSVILDVWHVDTFTGLPHGREGQEIKWVKPDELIHLKFPAANIPVINSIRLPPIYLITPDPGEDSDRFLSILERALSAGIRMVQLRVRDSMTGHYMDIARRAQDLCRSYEAIILLNTRPEQAEEIDADGVHLNSKRLMAMNRRPVSADRWLSASCHNLRELKQAMLLGVDFVVISPVLATSSHPHANLLGWKGFKALCDQASIPAYALGGMTPRHITTAWSSGAQGIAAISAFWESSTLEQDILECLEGGPDRQAPS
jgi:8-oxo-dGTP diphosphatase